MNHHIKVINYFATNNHQLFLSVYRVTLYVFNSTHFNFYSKMNKKKDVTKFNFLCSIQK